MLALRRDIRHVQSRDVEQAAQLPGDRTTCRLDAFDQDFLLGVVGHARQVGEEQLQRVQGLAQVVAGGCKEACLGVSQAQDLVATCLQFTRGVLDTEFERFVAAPEFVRDDGQLLQLAPDQHAGNQQREQCESRKQCSAPGLLPPLLGQQRAGVILMTRRLLCPGTGSVVATKEPLSWGAAVHVQGRVANAPPARTCR